MNNTTQIPMAGPAQDDAISLVEIASPILRHWRLVVILPTLFAFSAGVWSYTRDRQFVASASVIQRGTEGKVTGGVATLAQQFDVNLGGDRSLESPQFFADLLKSKMLLRKTVEAEYQITDPDGKPWKGTLIQFWRLSASNGIPAWISAAARLRGAMTSTVNRETGVLQLTVAADHPLLAEQIANKLLEGLDEFNLGARQGRAQDEGRFIGSRVTAAQTELLNAEVALLDFLRRNRQFENAPELVLERDRLQRRVSMRQEVYTWALQSLEQTRIDAIRDTPLFAVIDHPNGTAVPRSRGTISKALIGFVIGLLLAFLIALVRDSSRRRKAGADPQYREFQALLHETLHELRNPARWISRRTPQTLWHH